MAPGAGFAFSETMAGTYVRRDAPGEARPFSFTCEAKANSIVGHLRDGTAKISGTVFADGLANGQPLSGTMLLRPLFRRLIRYDFQFKGDDGEHYRFTGEKRIKLRALARTFTELPAQITDSAGNVVATATTRFDLRSDFVRFLRSWHLRSR